MISLPPPPEKPQCRHHNDADNCLLCGTKPIKERKPEPTRSSAPVYVYRPKFCKAHDCPTPCAVCVVESWVVDKQAEKEVQRFAEVQRINEVSNSIWAEVLQKYKADQRARFGEKCDHGHLCATEYCNVCSIRLIDPNYNPNTYQTQIARALKNAKRVFGGVERRVRHIRDEDGNPVFGSENLTEGQKNFAEIEMLVDLEIWKACRAYGEEMNAALAYRVARNTAGRFISDLIDDQTIVVDIAWEFMTPEICQKAEALVAEVGLDGLLRLSRDDRADAEERKFAKQIINEYGERSPRFESLDAPNELASDMNDGETTSAVEYKFRQQEEQNAGRAPISADLFDIHRDSLAALVASWRGDLRKVGEAVLAGTFTVRGVPGVSKSTAGRSYQKVTAAFRSHIAKSSPVSTIQAIEK
jgi:hypothetical protein